METSVGAAFAILGWVLFAIVVLVGIGWLVGRYFVRRGKQPPWVVTLINRFTDEVVDRVKHPITVAVLDEVAAVLKTGHYTRNIASALEENRVEIKAMVAEKIVSDPKAGYVRYLPFHREILELTSETTLRVIFEILADPRTDELVSDLLRDNITQIRAQVVTRQYG
ncbi:hypothetical protein [Williamsia sp. CHRR-6]|uniref:hypothetical protein n=1 Tax=Williamsia sp. CHRR-6 TaxID=2835871 RepID=UPI001BDAB486|nr:hypothetical protein [Williamsia sp. CHRR-6]MBT0565197.1 hypothetical protein [Williamsia sp. CHRR-6]